MSITNTIIEAEAVPAMIDPPILPCHPTYNPCAGCPRRQEPDIIRYGSIVLNDGTKRAHWRGQLMPFTKSEFKVVCLLVVNQGYPVTYRAIYDVVQRPGFVAGTSVNGCENGCHTNVRSMVKRIRRKFQKVEPSWNNIVNYTGVGYSWSMD